MSGITSQIVGAFVSLLHRHYHNPLFILSNEVTKELERLLTELKVLFVNKKNAIKCHAIFVLILP